MATKDISDVEVCRAYRDAAALRNQRGTLDITDITDIVWPEDLLRQRTGQPLKVCQSAMARADGRGLVDYGVSLRAGFLTPAGKKLLEENETRPATKSRSCQEDEPAMEDEASALCLHCRRTFTEVELADATACPNCGSRGVPADPRRTMTATLTTHEWRLLCIWAHNWGEQVSGDNPVEGIVGEIRRQNPDAPPLTMGEEFAMVKAKYPEAEIVLPSGGSFLGAHVKRRFDPQ